MVYRILQRSRNISVVLVAVGDGTDGNNLNVCLALLCHLRHQAHDHRAMIAVVGADVDVTIAIACKVLHVVWVVAYASVGIVVGIDLLHPGCCRGCFSTELFDDGSPGRRVLVWHRAQYHGLQGRHNVCGVFDLNLFEIGQRGGLVSVTGFHYGVCDIEMSAYSLGIACVKDIALNVYAALQRVHQLFLLCREGAL